MQHPLIVLLLIHINFMTAVTHDLPTKRFATKDPVITPSDKLLSVTLANDEERWQPGDELLEAVLKPNTLESISDNGNTNNEVAALNELNPNLWQELEPLDLSVEDYLVDDVKMQANLEAEEGNKQEETAAFNKAETLQVKTADHHSSNVDAYFQDPNGVQSLSDLKYMNKLKCFIAKVEKDYEGRSDIEMIKVQILEQHFEKAQLAETLQALSSKQFNLKELMFQWRDLQMLGWLHRHESVMYNLGFKPEATRIVQKWNFNALERCTYLHNFLTKDHETLASALYNAYGKSNFLKMIVTSHNHWETVLVTRIQNQLFKGWQQHGLKVNEIIPQMDVKDVIRFLTTTTVENATALYPTIQGVGTRQMLLWVEILAKNYDLSSVIVELFRLSKVNSVAKALLDQELTRLVRANWSVKQLDNELDFSGNGTRSKKATFNKRKDELLELYREKLSQHGNPTKKARVDRNPTSRII